MLLYIPNSWITTYALKFKYAGHGLFSYMNFNRDKKLYSLSLYRVFYFVRVGDVGFNYRYAHYGKSESKPNPL
jgi:hypothetical protein